MEKAIQSYIDVIRYCLAEDRVVPESIRYISWNDLLRFTNQHAITGVVAHRLLYDKRLISSDVFLSNPLSEDDVMNWMAVLLKIERNNEQANQTASWASDNFEKIGFDSCLLKGQGVGLLYPKPKSRTSGDVDIWVRPHRTESNMINGRNLLSLQRKDVEHVLTECHRVVPTAKACYHHTDFITRHNTPIEVHYRPQWLSNPLYNRRLQVYFMKKSDAQFKNKVSISSSDMVSVPQDDFNAVFLLVHIYNHLFHEGIGFRQIIDYFYLLTKSEELAKQQDWEMLFANLGIKNIAGSLMWILINCLGMDKKFALVPMDERRGRFVLNEILASGNFGHYDTRYHFSNNVWGHNMQRLFRDVRLFRYFPSESLFEPCFRLYHAWWRWLHKERN